MGPHRHYLRMGAMNDEVSRELYKIANKHGEEGYHFDSPLESFQNLLSEPRRAMFFVKESMYSFHQLR